MHEDFYPEVRKLPCSHKKQPCKCFLIQPQYSLCVHGNIQNMKLFITDIQFKRNVIVNVNHDLVNLDM